MEVGKQLHRSRDAYFGGVCAGIADYLDMDVLAVRIFCALIVLLTCGVAGIVYAVLWAVLPLEVPRPHPLDVEPKNVESSHYGCVDCDAARGRGADAAAREAYRERAARLRTYRETGHTPPVPPGAAPATHGAYVPPSGENALPHDYAWGSEVSDGISMAGRIGIAAGLVALFGIVSSLGAPIVPGTQWWQFWPFGLMIVGLCLIVVPIKSGYALAWHLGGVALVIAAGGLAPLALGLLLWETCLVALARFWVILVGGAVCFAFGVRRRSSALMSVGVALFGLFVLVGLAFCGIPAGPEQIVFQLPNGRVIILDMPPQ